jgi:superfamily I DNA/RNA helicase
MTTPLQPLFRQAQQDIIHYKSGQMAVSAVPGSGKTFTLTHLAANLVGKLSAKDILNNTEILVVTFSNSAVFNHPPRYSQIIKKKNDKMQIFCQIFFKKHSRPAAATASYFL